MPIAYQMSPVRQYCDCDNDSNLRKRSAPFTTTFLSLRSSSQSFGSSYCRLGQMWSDRGASGAFGSHVFT